MKKIFFLATFVAALFTSCSESEYEFHQTYFTPQEPNGKLLYADQVTDSTRLISYDPWTASTVFNSGTDAWFTITPTSCQFTAGEQFASMRIDIQGSVNNTGKIRSGHIVVKSYDTIGMLVKQTTWLNIVRPFGSVETQDAAGNVIPEEERKMVFSASTFATENQFDIEFTVYADNATLTSDAEWLVPTATTFEAGTHKVAVVAKENLATEPRTANLILTSNGISTPITITQAKNNNQ
jgi:hypothetical protein